MQERFKDQTRRNHKSDILKHNTEKDHTNLVQKKL